MSGVILYGVPAPGLVETPPGALQVSPLIPGSQDLAALPDTACDAAFVLAPGGTLERNFVLAHALRTLKPGGRLSVFAPKEKGGARLRKALERLGCVVTEDARRHHRFAHAARPAELRDLDAVLAAGAPRRVADLGLWSQPGVFSWDRIDPGTKALADYMPALSGRGADLGCGLGLLAARVLTSPAVTTLTGLDIDRRAIDCASHNLNDARVDLRWADVRQPLADRGDLDFVVMNPPFHEAGAEDRELGVGFIRAAGAMLRRGGVCWLVANRHLPYEAPLASAFATFHVRAELGGYKIIEARR